MSGNDTEKFYIMHACLMSRTMTILCIYCPIDCLLASYQQCTLLRKNKRARRCLMGAKSGDGSGSIKYLGTFYTMPKGMQHTYINTYLQMYELGRWLQKGNIFLYSSLLAKMYRYLFRYKNSALFFGKLLQ